MHSHCNLKLTFRQTPLAIFLSIEQQPLEQKAPFMAFTLHAIHRVSITEMNPDLL